MEIRKKKSKIVLSILTLFFVSLLVAPFIPVWAEGSTVDDTPGEEWDGKITDPIPEPTDEKPEEKPAEPAEPAEIPQTPAEPKAEEVNPTPVVKPVAKPATKPVATSTTPVAEEEPIIEDAPMESTEEGSKVEVIEVLETEEKIEVPETAAPSKSPKFTKKMRKITLMSLTASGIVFFTGIILWAGWKLKNLPPEQKTEPQN